MKSNHTQSTDPHESGYPTSTNLKTTSRLARCKAQFSVPLSHRITKGENQGYFI